MTDDNRIKAMEEITNIFNKYDLSYNNMISVTYATLTNVLIHAIKRNPEHRSEYYIGASKALDYMLEEIDRRLGGQEIEK